MNGHLKDSGIILSVVLKLQSPDLKFINNGVIRSQKGKNILEILEF